MVVEVVVVAVLSRIIICHSLGVIASWMLVAWVWIDW